MDNTFLIKIDNVTKTYQVGETQVNALKGASHNIKPGELLAIMGPSGSGKSTLMNIIGCLDKPTSGKYFLEGKEVSTFNKNQLAGIRNKKIGFVFQNFNLLARTTALENTELPLIYSNIPAKQAREMALKALDQVGLGGRELHKSNQISGGEKQRAALVAALLLERPLYLLDEVTSALDEDTKRAVVDYLGKRKDLTLLLVSHDKDIKAMSDEAFVLKKGDR